MEEITKIIKRLCELLYLNKNVSLNYNIQELVRMVGITKERFASILLNYQNSEIEKVNSNLFFSDYNPVNDNINTDDFIYITLTKLGEYLVEQNDIFLYNESINFIKVSNE